VCGGAPHGPLQQRFAADAHQLLGRAEAAGLAGGQHQHMGCGFDGHRDAVLLACMGTRRPLEFAGFFPLNNNFSQHIDVIQG
jgi:hypothetical protein